MLRFDDTAHTIDPDLFTASPEYAGRFAGPVGEYFLERQRSSVETLLKRLPLRPLTILELGGGHLQVTQLFVDEGHAVTIHGSTSQAFERLDRSPLQDRVQRLVAPLSALESCREEFDLVVLLRLLPHVQDGLSFLRTISRLARHGMILDFASTGGLNALSPLLFGMKRKIEGNTRPYFLHSQRDIEATLREQGFHHFATEPQFTIPMGLHRKLKNASISRLSEGLCASIGLTRFLGNPIILGAYR